MFSKKNSDHLDLVIAAILEKFAGQTVQNSVLKAYLCNKLPEMFPSNRADGAVEALSDVDFASTKSKTGQQGVAFLEGITEGNRRLWRVPASTDNVVAKSDVAEVLKAPLGTKKLKKFGEIPSKAE